MGTCTMNHAHCARKAASRIAAMICGIPIKPKTRSCSRSTGGDGMVTVGVDMGTIDFLMLKALAGDEVGRSAGRRFDSHEKVGRDILHLHVRARDCEHHEIR